MDTELRIQRFKMDLLRKMPFYGDIVMRLPITENRGIPTAQTNGGKIEYNPDFFSQLTAGQINFVMLHEVFHVLLFHCERSDGRDPRLWNTAADMIVNSMLTQLMPGMKGVGIPFERPLDGIFANVGAGATVENLYEKLLKDNRDMKKNAVKVLVRLNDRRDPVEAVLPDDIVFRDAEPSDGGAKRDGGRRGSAGNGPPGFSETELSPAALKEIIRNAAAANRASMGSYFVPGQLFGLTESRRINWQRLLREFFLEEQSEEVSYVTPERKYIHMDLLLPGHGASEEKIEEIWAFADSSGSVGKNEMDQFLTQLYRIAKEFRCVFNICYWDTQVTDVYRKLLKEDDVLKSIPRHSGGTDVNCVYRWLRENKVDPDVMLILTDGYFGTLDKRVFKPSLGKKTILVLSGGISENDDMKRMGKITRLEQRSNNR